MIKIPKKYSSRAKEVLSLILATVSFSCIIKHSFPENRLMGGKKCIFHKQYQTARTVLYTRDSMEIKRLCNLDTNDRWKEVKEKVMMEIVEAAAFHSKQFRDALSSSGNSPLHENTGHPFWGCHGKDILGKILMQVRGNINTQVNVTQEGHEGHEDTSINENIEKQETNIFVIGNSMLKGIDSRGINPNRHSKTFIKNAQNIEKATEVMESLENPTSIVYHLITNDIEEKSAATIEKELITLVGDTQQKHRDIKIAISLAHPRGDNSKLHLESQLLNAMITMRFHDSETVCVIHNDNFFRNGTMNKQLFDQKDNVHLSDNGKRMFASNLKHGINKTI